MCMRQHSHNTLILFRINQPCNWMKTHSLAKTFPICNEPTADRPSSLSAAFVCAFRVTELELECQPTTDHPIRLCRTLFRDSTFRGLRLCTTSLCMEMWKELHTIVVEIQTVLNIHTLCFPVQSVLTNSLWCNTMWQWHTWMCCWRLLWAITQLDFVYSTKWDQLMHL